MPRPRTPVAEEPEVYRPDPEPPENPLKAYIDVFQEDWKALPLAAKLAKIAGNLGNVSKKGWNPNQRYKFVQETDLVAAIRPYLTAAGILLMFSVTEHEIIPRQSAEAKGLLTRVRLRWTVTDGVQELHGDMDGYGMDAGDKGIYKAITGAKKYVLTTLFLIDTGDDPEADTKTDEMAEHRPPQRVALSDIRVGREVGLGEIGDDPPRRRTVIRQAIEREPGYGEDEGPPVVSPLRRTDIVRGGHTTEATDLQKARFVEAVRQRDMGARQLLQFLRTELGATLIDAPEEEPARLRSYITELLDSLDPATMGRLLVVIEDGE